MINNMNSYVLHNKPVRLVTTTLMTIGFVFLVIATAVILSNSVLLGSGFLYFASACFIGAWFGGYYISPSKLVIDKDELKIYLRYRKKALQVNLNEIEWIGRKTSIDQRPGAGGLKLRSRLLPFMLENRTASTLSKKYEEILGHEAPFPK